MTVSQPQTVTITSRPAGRRWPARWVWWLGLGIAALLFLVVISAPLTKDGSTYERSPTGYRNWYTTLQRQGIEIGRWQKDYDRLQGTGQTLLQIRGDRLPESSNLVEDEIENWVRQGNTFIRLGWTGKVTNSPFSSRLDSPAGGVLIETTRRLTSREPDQQSVLADQAGSVIWSRQLAAGELVGGTYPWLAANAYANDSVNHQFLTSLVQQRGGKIWVDEWIHGYRDPEKVAPNGKRRYQDVLDYLQRTPVFPLAVQIGLILLFLLWHGNQRFGRLKSLPPPDLANSERYIQSLAGVLNNCHHTNFVLDRLGVQFRRQLASQLGLSLDQGRESIAAQDQDLAAAWASQSGRSPQEVLRLLQQIQTQRRLSDQELLTWVGMVESILRGSLERYL